MTISNPIFSNSSILKPVKLGNRPTKKDSTFSLMIAACGVVFGDIGTSPLYAIKVCLAHEHGHGFSPPDIFGVISLVFWALMIIVSIKYTLFIMRANNQGEGGILALMALAMRATKADSRQSKILMMLGVFGACMFYGDAVITPAISVMSAVEGLEVVSKSFVTYVAPITMIILIILFVFQKFGTAIVGVVFGPIMLVWFFLLAIMGITNIINAPEILYAASPFYAVEFLRIHTTDSLVVIGGVFFSFNR